MHAEPFTCYRPSTPEDAQTFASLPYDVFDRAQAAEYVVAHPKSFLAIDRPETAFSPDHDMYADDVYAKAAELLHNRVEDKTLLRDGSRCYYLYRLEQDGRSQTGIVAACSIDDYANGVIARHENTRRDKEEDRVRHIRATGCQTGPIFLAYRDNPTLEALVEAAKGAQPAYDFTDEQGVRQTVWRVGRPAAVEAFRMMLELVPKAYIADGHHRAASAARVCQEMRSADKDCDGREAYNYLMCVMFPQSQLTVLPYYRVVKDTNGLDEKDLVEALEAAGFTVGDPQEAAVAPTEHGQFGLFAFGKWRAFSPAAADEDADVVARLDVSVLQDKVLGPILGIDDPRQDPRVKFVGGNVGLGELEEAAGQTGIAFTLCATSVGEMMAVADAGKLMPPKSTWFEPKLRSGLFIRRISSKSSLLDGVEQKVAQKLAEKNAEEDK